MDERTNGSTTNSPSFSSCYIFYMYWYSASKIEREKVIDTESLYSSIQCTATAEILSLHFFLRRARRRRPEDSVRRWRWSWEFSRFFSLHCRSRHCQHQVSQHTRTHSSYEGIEEHERDPACFGFFDTINCYVEEKLIDELYT